MESDASEQSWEDDPLEDPEVGAAYNAEMNRRQQLLEERRQTMDWCRCLKCCPVEFAQTSLDVTCCQEITEVKATCQEYLSFGAARPYSCITEHPAFNIQCLYDRHLQNVAHLYQIREFSGRRGTDRNMHMRYTAYKSFTTWIYGRLGYRNRVAVPQCVLKAIRRKYPDENDNYTGFREPDPQ